MTYLTKAKELYNNKDYDICLELLYENDNRVRTVVLAVGFALVTGISASDLIKRICEYGLR